jgi:hypothetical protein
MARTNKNTIEPTEMPAAPPIEPVFQPAPEPKPEPKTVVVSAQVLAETMAAFAFALAAYGADSLSPEGRAAFRGLVGDLDATAGTPAARHEIPAEAAFWISHDLLGSRHRRPTLTAGEVMLGQAVTAQTPKLAGLLAAVASKRGKPQGAPRVERPLPESPCFVADPRNASFPQGQHFDHLGRATSPKRSLSGIGGNM